MFINEYQNIDQVLLVGLLRSGTTWVAKLIDSHPDIYRHEPYTEFRIRVPVIIDEVFQEYIKSITDYCDGIIDRTGVRV